MDKVKEELTLSTINLNGVEIAYGEEYLDMIREKAGKAKGSAVSHDEILAFFQGALQAAVDKGYGIEE